MEQINTKQIDEGWGPEINMYSGWYDKECDEFYFQDNGTDLVDGWLGTEYLVFSFFVKAAVYAAA